MTRNAGRGSRRRGEAPVKVYVNWYTKWHVHDASALGTLKIYNGSGHRQKRPIGLSLDIGVSREWLSKPTKFSILYTQYYMHGEIRIHLQSYVYNSNVYKWVCAYGCCSEITQGSRHYPPSAAFRWLLSIFNISGLSGLENLQSVLKPLRTTMGCLIARFS